MTDSILSWLIKLIEENNLKAFYNCIHWLHKRAEALERDNYECQRCKANGLYSPAECVHHMKHVKKFPQLALNLDNLISLCNSCHDLEHPEKLKVRRKPLINKERW